MKIMYLSKVLAILIPFSALAQASGEKGNGGDFIRLAFMERGAAVIEHLSNDDSGKKLASSTRLSLKNLQSTLTTNAITVVSETLIDNTGSLVDSIGEKGAIKLSYDPWRIKIFRGDAVDRMVFHEMLRATGVNDDDFRVSKNIPERINGKAVSLMPPVFRAMRALFFTGTPVVDADLVGAAKWINSTLLKCTEATSRNGVYVSGLRYFSKYQFGIVKFSFRDRDDRWFSDFDGSPGMGAFIADTSIGYHVSFIRKVVEDPQSERHVLLIETVSEYGSDGIPSIQSSNLRAVSYQYCEAYN